MGRRRSGFRVLGPYSQRGGRLWTLAIRGGPLPDGVSPNPTFPTRRAAERAKRAILAGYEAPEPVTMTAAIDSYLDHLRATGREESTVGDAGYRLRPLAAQCPELLEDVRTSHVEARLAELPSHASRVGVLTRARAAWRWWVEQQWASTNPCEAIRLEGRKEAGKTTLTRREARVLAERLWAEAEAGGEVALALLVVLYTGLRRGEVLRLQVRDLDLDVEPPVVCVERRAKTAAGYRDVELTPDLARLLRRRVDGWPLSAWLWPASSATGHREGTWLRKALTARCRAAGVQEVCPQGLRATHGRLSREAGATARVIADSLGHESETTTVRSYIGTEADGRERQRKALRVIDGGGK